MLLIQTIDYFIRIDLEFKPEGHLGSGIFGPAAGGSKGSGFKIEIVAYCGSPTLSLNSFSKLLPQNRVFQPERFIFLHRRSQKKNNVFWANYDASNPVESSGIVGKNFPFDLRIEALHRFEPGNRVELA